MTPHPFLPSIPSVSLVRVSLKELVVLLIALALASLPHGLNPLGGTLMGKGVRNKEPIRGREWLSCPICQTEQAKFHSLPTPHPNNPLLYYRRTDNSSYRDRIPLRIVRAESELSPLEKAYLSAVEKGDYASVKQALEEAEIYFKININCIDPLGRTALLIAIENENLEIIELLLSFNVYVGDALLHAIRKEVVGAVELLLNHKKPSGGMQVPPILLDKQFSDFTPDITPIILAAHTNNYEIIKLLVQKGVSVPQPHEVRCNCVECVSSSDVDSLRHSRSRLNIYRALASPSLIALSSEDPFLTAFQLSWELQELSKVENEFKSEYEELSHQCKQFAKDLLDQTRSSRELEMILNFRDDINPLEEENNNDLARLKLAIKYHQKEVAGGGVGELGHGREREARRQSGCRERRDVMD
ncbi:hypothetical protein JZ751_023032 [Albula glossodonta]|uniref:Transient receptor ion channel domain-containing protein n=1 Tax=Albula glossodonta TaxID=121402 RepID=A0A8T2PKN6_9TELE|nr:hypothetical protein JZ751_023032 [Albula glossodonta]